MLIWRLGRTVPGKYGAKDLTGTGAFLHGGRWNSPGHYAVYGSLNPGSAVLESIVRLGALGINPIDRYLISIEIPDAVWNDPKVGGKKARGLPQHWDAIPHHQATMLYGDKWLEQGTHLGLLVPSAIVHEEWNVLLNPLHPAMRHVKVKKARPFVFDPRRAAAGTP